jgi:hypothetical protein
VGCRGIELAAQNRSWRGSYSPPLRCNDTAAELFRERIQGLFCNLNEILSLHHSPLAQAVHLHRVASIVLLFVTFITRTVSFIFLFVILLVWLFP